MILFTCAALLSLHSTHARHARHAAISAPGIYSMQGSVRWQPQGTKRSPRSCERIRVVRNRSLAVADWPCKAFCTVSKNTKNTTFLLCVDNEEHDKRRTRPCWSQIESSYSQPALRNPKRCRAAAPRHHASRPTDPASARPPSSSSNHAPLRPRSTAYSDGTPGRFLAGSAALSAIPASHI